MVIVSHILPFWNWVFYITFFIVIGFLEQVRIRQEKVRENINDGGKFSKCSIFVIVKNIKQIIIL